MNPSQSPAPRERGAAVPAASHPQQSEALAPGTRAPRFKPFDKEAPIQKTRRLLPHWEQDGCTCFITWRMADAMPAAKRRQWRAELDAWLEQHPKPWDAAVWQEYHSTFEGPMQEWLDAGHGSCALRDPALRDIIASSFHHYDARRYHIGDYIIMPNHVHVLVTPLPGFTLREITAAWKRYTGHEILKRTGGEAPFWLEESFDHIVRSPAQLDHYRRYIRENPAKAFLKPGQWTHWAHPATTAQLRGFHEPSGLNYAEPNRGAAVPAATPANAALPPKPNRGAAVPAATPVKAAVPAAPLFVATLLLLLTLFGALPSQAQTDFARPAESPVFELNTKAQTDLARPAESPIFELDTTTQPPPPPAISTGEFNLDTRAPTPEQRVDESGAFAVDTRNTLPVGLAISGPAEISSGGTASYKVFWQPSGGPASDVTAQTTLAFADDPPLGTGIGGWTVFAGRVASRSSFQIRARYRNGVGQILSAPFTVTIQPTLLLTISAKASGSVGATTLALRGSAAGGTPPYTITWDTDKNLAYDDATGVSVDVPFNRNTGTHVIRARAKDANGSTTEGSVLVTLNAPPVQNEPPLTKPKPDADIGSGTLKDADGNRLVLDPAKTAVGLVVIVHGLDMQGTNNLSWMRNMAKDIRERCQREGRGEPQIILYEWPSNPSSQDGIDVRAQAILDSTEWTESFSLFKGRVGSAPDHLLDAALEKVMDKLAKTYLPANLAKSWKIMNKPLLVAEFARGVAHWWEPAYDLLQIKPTGLEKGSFLASWVATEAARGKIDPLAPTHFIGHSAGGFVVTQAGVQLKQWVGINGKTFASNPSFMVTCLDTPFPEPSHFSSFPQPGRIERYITQIGGQPGGLNFAWGLEKVDWIWDDFNFFDALTWFPKSGLNFLDPPRAPGRYYRRLQIPLRAFPDGSPRTAAHSYAYAWYAATIRARENDRATEGFYFSPILGNRPFPGYGAGGGFRAPRDGVPGPAVVPIAATPGTFGSVNVTASDMTITEEANAGFWFDVSIPEFAHSLAFSYRFQNAGDGDFLSVEVDGDDRLVTGADTDLSRGQFLMEESDIRRYAGTQIRLIFRLVSRGSPNAVVRVKDICFRLSNDADGDGIANQDEAANGTNPRESDSDFDGLSDGFEIANTRTSPTIRDTDGDGQSDREELLADTDPSDGNSHLRILSWDRNPLDGSVTLVWPTSNDRLYRVICSESMDGDTYSVVSPEMASNTGIASFTHRPESPVTRSFYWIECLNPE